MKKELTTMKDTIKRIEEEADELIEFGNSKEIAKGKGMQYVIEEIKEYCKKHNIIL